MKNSIALKDLLFCSNCQYMAIANAILDLVNYKMDCIPGNCFVSHFEPVLIAMQSKVSLNPQNYFAIKEFTVFYPISYKKVQLQSNTIFIHGSVIFNPVSYHWGKKQPRSVLNDGNKLTNELTKKKITAELIRSTAEEKADCVAVDFFRQHYTDAKKNQWRLLIWKRSWNSPD